MPSSRVLDRVRMFDSSSPQDGDKAAPVKNNSPSGDHVVVPRQAKSRYSSPGRAAMARSRHRMLESSRNRAASVERTSSNREKDPATSAADEHRQDLESRQRKDSEEGSSSTTVPRSGAPPPSPAKAPVAAPSRRRVPRRSLSPSPRKQRVQHGSPLTSSSPQSQEKSNASKPPSPHIVTGQTMIARRRFEAQRTTPKKNEQGGSSSSPSARPVVRSDQGGVPKTPDRPPVGGAHQSSSPASPPKSRYRYSSLSPVRARAIENIKRHRRSPSPARNPSPQKANGDGSPVVSSPARTQGNNVKTPERSTLSPMSRLSNKSPGRTMAQRHVAGQNSGSPSAATGTHNTTPKGSEKSGAPSPSYVNKSSPHQRKKSGDFTNRPSLLVSGRSDTAPGSKMDSPAPVGTVRSSPLRNKTCFPSPVRAFRHIGTRSRVASPISDRSPEVPPKDGEKPVHDAGEATSRHDVDVSSPSRATVIRQNFERRGRASPASPSHSNPDGSSNVRPLKRIVSPRQAAVLRQVEARNHASPTAMEIGREHGRASVPKPGSEQATTSPNLSSPGTKRVKAPQSKYYSLYEKTVVGIKSKEQSPSSERAGLNASMPKSGSRYPAVNASSPAQRRSSCESNGTQSPARTNTTPSPETSSQKLVKSTTRASPSPSRNASPGNNQSKPRSEAVWSTSSPRPVVADNPIMRRLGGATSSPSHVERKDIRVGQSTASSKFATFPIAGNQATDRPSQHRVTASNRLTSGQTPQEKESRPSSSNKVQPLLAVSRVRPTPSKYYTVYAQKMNDTQKNASPVKGQRSPVAQPLSSKDSQGSFFNNVQYSKRENDAPTHGLASSSLDTRSLATKSKDSVSSRRTKASRLMDMRARSPALFRGFNNELKRNLNSAAVVMEEEKAISVTSSSSSRSSLSNEELGNIASRAMRLGKGSSAGTKTSFSKAGTFIHENKKMHSIPTQQSGSAFSSTKAANVMQSKNPTVPRLSDRLSKADKYAARMKQRKGVLITASPGKKEEGNNGDHVAGAANIRRIRREGMARAAKQASRASQEPTDKSLASDDSLSRNTHDASPHSRRQKARELARKFEQRKHDTQKISREISRDLKARSAAAPVIRSSTDASKVPHSPWTPNSIRSAPHTYVPDAKMSPARGSWQVNREGGQQSSAEGAWPMDGQDGRFTPFSEENFSPNKEVRLSPAEEQWKIVQNFSPGRARHADDSVGADELWQPSPRKSSPFPDQKLSDTLEVSSLDVYDQREVSSTCSISPSKKTDNGDIKPGDGKPWPQRGSMSPSFGSPGSAQSMSRFHTTRSKFESPQSHSGSSHEEARKGGSPSFKGQPQHPQLTPDERRTPSSTTMESIGMWDIAHTARYTRFDDTQYQEAMNPFAISEEFSSASFPAFDETAINQDPANGPVVMIDTDTDASNYAEDKPNISKDLGKSGDTSEAINKNEASRSSGTEESKQGRGGLDEFVKENVASSNEEYGDENMVSSSDYDEEPAEDDVSHVQIDSADPAKGHATSNKRPDSDGEVTTSDVDNSMLMGEGFAEDSSTNKASSADETGRIMNKVHTAYSSSSSSHFSKSTTSKDEMTRTFSRYTVSAAKSRLEPISDEDQGAELGKPSPEKRPQEQVENKIVQLTEVMESETVKVKSNEPQWPTNASQDTIRWWRQNYARNAGGTKGPANVLALKSIKNSKSPRSAEKDDEDVFSGLEEDATKAEEEDPDLRVGFADHEDSSDEEQENQPYHGSLSLCRTPGSTRTPASSYFNGISLEEFSSLPPPPPPPFPPPPPPPPLQPSSAVLQPKAMNQNASPTTTSPASSSIGDSKLAKYISSGISSPGKTQRYSPRDRNRDVVETIEEEDSASESSGPEDRSEDEVSEDKSSEDETSDEDRWSRSNQDRKEKFRAGMMIDKMPDTKTPTSDITSSLIARPALGEKDISISDSTESEDQGRQSKSIPLQSSNSGLSPSNSTSEDDGIMEDDSPEADDSSAGNSKTKNTTTRDSPGAIFMTIGYSIVDSITTVCRMPETIPQMAECGNTTEDFFEQARAQAPDLPCRCPPHDANTKTEEGATAFPFSTDHISVAGGSYSGLNERERRVWNDWEIRDKKGSSTSEEQGIEWEPPPRQPSPHQPSSKQPSPGEAAAHESTDNVSDSTSLKIQHEQKRKLAQEQLLLHARNAKDLEFPGQRAVSILTENATKAPSNDPPKIAESALSNTQRLVLERFSTMLRNERVEVLKLNRHEKWQLRYLTVSKEVAWIRGEENPSDVGQCPQALLWFKTPHAKHGGVGNQGRGGFKFTQLLRIERDTSDTPAIQIPKKLKAKFPDYVGVRISYAYEGGSRDLVFCLRDAGEARAFCTAMEIIREVVQREEKVLEAASTRSPSQNSSASSACTRPRTPNRSPRNKLRSPGQKAGAQKATA